MTTTRKTSKLETEAMTLFGVSSVDKVSTVLWALGLREACGRCMGSGHYSRNSMGDTRCYDCKGRRERAARLTRKVLDQARVKVAAGELEACRARAKAQREAKAMVAPKVAAGEALYSEIADAYSAASRAARASDVYVRSAISEALYVAQDLNNTLFWGECPSQAFRRAPARGMRTVERDVEQGRLDGIKACAELDALLGMLVELRDAWRAWNAAQRGRMRAAAHARLAA